MAKKKSAKAKSPDAPSPVTKQPETKVNGSVANGSATSKQQANGKIDHKSPALLNGTSHMTADEAAQLRAEHKQLQLEWQRQDSKIKALTKRLAAAEESSQEWQRAYAEARYWTYTLAGYALIATGVAVSAARLLARAKQHQ